MTTFADIEDRLTRPGGAFEVRREVVDGIEMKAYAQRFADLRSVAQIGAAYGSREFLVHGSRRITFADFFRSTNGIAASLAATGVRKGDRVAVLSQNNPEWCQTFWATVSQGAVLVGLNGWWTGDEIRFGLEDSGARVLVADRKRLDRIAEQLDDIETLEWVFVVDDEVDGYSSGKVRPFSDLTAGTTDNWPTAEIDESDHAVIFYTSGTTGRPKGAISTHRSMIANLQNTVFLLTAGSMLQAELVAEGTIDPPSSPTPSEPVALFTSPLFHVAGCHSTLVVGVMGGLRLVMPVGRFDPVEALRLIESERVSIWATVPTMIWRTTEHPERHAFDLSTVISVSFGGSPTADELQRRIRETFPNVRATTNAYGLTESSSAATVLTGPDSMTRADTVGRPLPVVEIAIGGPDGSHLDAGQVGEVLIRGPILMAGYWNRPEATAETIRDGWLHTGDIGRLSEDGYLSITDRAKDMIIRGGENVYCVEIEERLVEHPAIADAAVIGVPHPELGEEVKAVVEIAAGCEVSDDELRRWVAETLAAFKVPAHVERWPTKLPRNASGKLLKHVLRGQADETFAETM